VRVIGGSAKGVRLGPVPRGVRPVSDMAREGVFSSLGAAVRGASVLDLYAGTGAMAIEALSRLSYFTWTAGHRPLAGVTDWPSLAILAAIDVVLFAIGVFVFGRRDIGAVAKQITKLACLNRRLVFHGPPADFLKDETALSALYGPSMRIVIHEHP